mmetsp:Transcript_1268/g.2881  ORF Transcript_1268/g.2881 Transcript_1268/m.2881 type:complete len:106 (+) Transcript_1268:100-417(+)
MPLGIAAPVRGWWARQSAPRRAKFKIVAVLYLSYVHYLAAKQLLRPFTDPNSAYNRHRRHMDKILKLRRQEHDEVLKRLDEMDREHDRRNARNNGDDGGSGQSRK